MSNNTTRTSFDGIERNRTGSPYIAVNLLEPENAQRIGSYFIDLSVRHKQFLDTSARYTDPILRPTAVEIEKTLLDTLVSQEGNLNLWDVSLDIFPEGVTTPGAREAFDSFVSSTGFEVQFVE